MHPMSSSGILKSSLAKKYAMALTGLFLCLFLVGHLLGNLQLFVPGLEGQTAFNEYAKFMTTFPLVKVLSYLTYASVLFHVVDGIALTLQNRQARPVRYAVEKGSANAGWSSRNMAVLGTVVLVFLVTHMQNFWWQMHFGDIPTQEVAGESLKDLHTVVLNFFNPATNSLALAAVALYVSGMFALGFHLWHGFSSAFQSMGLRHENYTPLVEKVGYAFAVVVPAAFASIPLYLYMTQA
jgi:succinate dehydrogenase / fumarate reductase cytochrome b subunit